MTHFFALRMGGLRSLGAIMMVITGALLMNACGGAKGPKHVEVIPKNAAMVVIVDVKQLIAKSMSLQKFTSKENLKEMGATEKEAEKASKTSQRFLDSGVDYLNTAYVFSEGNLSQQSGILVLAMDNASKFEKFLQDEAFWKENGGQKFTIQDGDIKTASNEKTTMAWSKKTLVISPNAKATTDQLKAFFALKKEDQLASANENFKKFLNNKDDIKVWSDIKNSGIDELSYLALVGGSEDTYVNTGINFEKGKLKITSDIAANETLSKDLFSKIARKGLESSTFKNIPVKDPQVGISLALDLKGIKEIAASKGGTISLNSELQKNAGTSLDELVNLFNGDILIIIEKISLDNPSGIIALGISDPKKFDQILVGADKEQMFSKEGEVYELKNKAILGPAASVVEGLYIVVKEKGAYITTTKAMRDKILKGESNLSGDFKNLASNNAHASYASESAMTLLTQSPGYKNDPIGEVFGANFPVASFTMQASKIQDKTIKTEADINLREKDKNSLMVLIDVINKVQEVEKKRQDKLKKEMEEMFKDQDTGDDGMKEGQSTPFEEEVIEE